MNWNEDRVKKVCQAAIEKLNLNLSGLKVVTEAASGLYAVTPLIALMAGAKEVVCLGKDTAYGSFDNIKDDIYNLARKWYLTRLIITNNRSDRRLNGADIVTNMGMVRPLDQRLLTLIGPQTVIPYMCEAWEVREGDIDFEICHQMGIPVMGTDENHPDVGVFNYCGMLAIKLLMEADFEIMNNKIAIISSDNFGPVIRNAVINCGGIAKVYSSDNDYYGIENEVWDVIIVAEYTKPDCILGVNGLISGNRLQRLLQNTYGVVQFAGRSEVDVLKKHTYSVYPNEVLIAYRMARTLAYLGLWPMILLHTAGLKVGEEMARAKRAGLTGVELEDTVLKRAPAQKMG